MTSYHCVTCWFPQHFTRNPDRLADGLPTLLSKEAKMARHLVVSFLAFYRKYARSTFANASAISATSCAAKFS